MPIKAVFFDVYNTLAGFHPPREEIQAAAASEYGLKLTLEGTARGYHEADAFMNEQNRTRPVHSMDPDERERFFAEYERRVLKGSGHDVNAEFAARVWHAVRRQEYRLRLFPDAAPTLDGLRGRGLRVGAISNINQPGDQLKRDLELTGHVDFVITSREAGAEKPHPPIFRAALARARVRPAEAVHVGDQIDSDILGAAAVGINPVLLDRYGNHPDYSAHPRITRLDEIAGVLDRMR
ncbi:MAG: HAD family hydrolase [Chloroflexi bacterium]|nr:HAD family hydrolase [Chloroflexota bacterium]